MTNVSNTRPSDSRASSRAPRGAGNGVLAAVSSFLPLFLAAVFLLIGHGLQLTLIPLRAAEIGFSPVQIGVAGSTYFAGFLLGCVLTPIAIARLGYVGGFALSSVVTASALLGYASSDALSGWLALRLLSGVGVAGFYTVIEAWINAGAENQVRGRVLSLYVVTNLAMVTIGQWLINVASVAGWTLFVVGALMMLLSLAPLLAGRPVVPQSERRTAGVDLKGVWVRSPVAFFVTLLSGIITGGFWTLAPVYAKQLGLVTWQVSLFMSMVNIAGAVCQYPLGRASDRVDRRTILDVTLLLVLVAGLLLASPWSRFVPVLYGAAVMWGAFALSVYGQCVAHANDQIRDGNFVPTAGALLLLWGLGAIAGPWVSAVLMQSMGPGGLFFASAIAAGVAWLGSVAIQRRDRRRLVGS